MSRSYLCPHSRRMNLQLPVPIRFHLHLKHNQHRPLPMQISRLLSSLSPPTLRLLQKLLLLKR
jgi:hypothetical protein